MKTSYLSHDRIKVCLLSIHPKYEFKNIFSMEACQGCLNLSKKMFFYLYLWKNVIKRMTVLYLYIFLMNYNKNTESPDVWIWHSAPYDANVGNYNIYTVSDNI